MVRGKITSPDGLSPQELLSKVVDSLARIEGNDQAARLLGLTASEIADYRERARRVHRHRLTGYLSLDH